MLIFKLDQEEIYVSDAYFNENINQQAGEIMKADLAVKAIRFSLSRFNTIPEMKQVIIKIKGALAN